MQIIAGDRSAPIIYTAHHASHDFHELSERCALSEDEKILAVRNALRYFPVARWAISIEILKIQADSRTKTTQSRFGTEFGSKAKN